MAKQLLHLVFGGALTAPGSLEFADLDQLDIVGIYPNYQTAYAAWRGAAQKLSTMLTSVTSSSTCTACSTQKPPSKA